MAAERQGGDGPGAGDGGSAGSPTPIRGAPKRSPKAAEVVARHLADYIIDNELPEGATLPVEREMLEMLDVGRASLREALRLLESWGLVEIRQGPRGGPVVRRPDAEDFTRALSLVWHYQGVSIGDVLAARAAFEPTLAALAAKRRSDEQAEALSASVARLLGNLKDDDVFVDENLRFHEIVAEAAHAVILRTFLLSIRGINEANAPAFPGVYSLRRRKAIGILHREIAEAIAARDATTAERLMREHVDDSVEYYRTKQPGLYGRVIQWKP